MPDPYSRDEFIADWASQLGCKPNAWDVAVHLINVNKNYSTAMAVCFGLSWNTNKDYLLKVTQYFQSVWDPLKDKATVEWLGQFVDHYITDKEKYPE